MSVESYIREIINKNGFIPMDEVMQFALTKRPNSYYRTRQPIGEDADFITAPEISQMFGEMIGIWCIDLWNKLGKPPKSNLLEFGAGRGSLMRDVLRTLKQEPEFYDSVSVRIIDINPTLKSIQKETLKDFSQDIKWISSLGKVEAQPTIILANEFFDALPVKEYFKQKTEWKERGIVIDPGEASFKFEMRAIKKYLSDHLMSEYVNASDGAVVEESPESIKIIQDIAKHISANGGGALIIDYGYDINPKLRNKYQYIQTMQAVKNHKFSPVLESIGESDISAHVDFWALKQAASTNEASVFGTVTQRDLLIGCGIDIRLEYLMRNNPDFSELLLKQHHRLTSLEQMGTLFKAMAVTSSSNIIPLGF